MLSTVATLWSRRIRRPASRLRKRWHLSAALRQLQRSRPGAGRPHTLPAELVVSLTSYSARFGTLHLTLRSLLAQTVRPDRLVLWVAHHETSQVPPEVWALQQFGLEVRPCDDLKSFKKLVPAIAAFPDAFIATADDDLYYPPNWLAELVAGSDTSEPVIVSHGVHRLTHMPDGRIAPYMSWQLDVQDARARSPSADILPTTGRGTLFPPRSLSSVVSERPLFERLCPTGDDLWFFWAAQLAGTKAKKVGDRFRLITWEDSQDSSLWAENQHGGNDRMIEALQREFPLQDRPSQMQRFDEVPGDRPTGAHKL